LNFLNAQTGFGSGVYYSDIIEKVNEKKEIKNMRCRYCNSLKVVKNGSNGMGKQKYQCKACKRQFVLNPYPNKISGSDQIKMLVKSIIY
jgi:transposase-like protein